MQLKNYAEQSLWLSSDGFCLVPFFLNILKEKAKGTDLIRLIQIEKMHLAFNISKVPNSKEVFQCFHSRSKNLCVLRVIRDVALQLFEEPKVVGSSEAISIPPETLMFQSHASKVQRVYLQQLLSQIIFIFIIYIYMKICPPQSSS